MTVAFRSYDEREYEEAVRVRLSFGQQGLEVRKPSEVALSEIELGWLASYDMDTESNQYMTPEERAQEIKWRAQSARVRAATRQVRLPEWVLA